MSLAGMEMIRQALDHAGYEHVEATPENLIECFRDYVDAGVWENLTLDDIEDITLTEMCKALLKLR